MITKAGNSLGERLQKAREWAGLSQQQAADSLGVAREVISYWENGRRFPPLAQMDRLAAAYGTTPVSYTHLTLPTT